MKYILWRKKRLKTGRTRQGLQTVSRLEMLAKLTLIRSVSAMLRLVFVFGCKVMDLKEYELVDLWTMMVRMERS